MPPKPKRGASQLSGIVLLDKPAGMTSHDCVDRVRYALGEGRVGHCGTLDPFATGLLVICVGAACKQAGALTKHDKEYVADICFGNSTDTYDCTGQVTEVSESLLPCLSDTAYAQETLQHFTGLQQQTPPAFSAKKVDGKRSYKLARAGQPVDLPAKEVTVISAELQDIISKTDNIVWQVRFVVSAGTYIRTLAHDIGQYVGVPAHLSALRRTKCGDFCVEDACTLNSISLLDKME